MPLNVFDIVGFHPLIESWFRQRFANPSPPQQLGWPSIADARHTLILAPTGSEKTLAAFLWSIDQLFELIQAHKTTLVFAGMQAQTEKIARALNQLHRQITGEPAAELALAHHGSISREARYRIEERLKSGDIPAGIAFWWWT